LASWKGTLTVLLALYYWVQGSVSYTSKSFVLGVGGDELISSILNVMYADRPYTVIRDSVQIHPTVSELVQTMLESLDDE
jgi:hypothetical protein